MAFVLEVISISYLSESNRSFPKIIQYVCPLAYAEFEEIVK